MRYCIHVLKIDNNTELFTWLQDNGDIKYSYLVEIYIQKFIEYEFNKNGLVMQ